MAPQQKQAKLYILVRSDIPVPDQCVQACHVNEMWCSRINRNGNRENGITVVLSIPGNAVSIWQRKIEQKVLSYCYFQEPDLGNITTAIACHTDTNIFASLPIWTGEPKGDSVY